jgi:hypothetical protein
MGASGRVIGHYSRLAACVPSEETCFAMPPLVTSLCCPCRASPPISSRRARCWAALGSVRISSPLRTSEDALSASMTAGRATERRKVPERHSRSRYVPWRSSDSS